MLVLASASPRRHELLRWLDVPYEVDAPDIDECPAAGECADALVRRLAREKAAAVSARRPEAWVLAADTTVEVGGALLGKPADAAEAAAMLERLAGREHHVATGFALVAPGGRFAAERCVVTRVVFRPLGRRALDAYVASGEFDGKAGGYAIQGRGVGLIETIDGSFTNVIGLPLSEVEQALAEAGLLAR